MPRRTSLSFLVVLAALAAVAAPVAASAQEPPAPATDADLRALVEKAGTGKDNGGADLVTVFKRTRVEVEPSGLAHIHDWQLVKCLSEKGAAQLARLRLDFDPTSNLVEVRSLRVLRRDGTVEAVSAENAVDLPQPQDAIYWGARMKLVPLPRLAVGDAVEIKTYMKGFLIAYLDEMGGTGATASGGDDEKYTPPMRGHFYDVVYFQDSVPVKMRHYELVTPRDKPVQFETYGGEVRTYVSFDDAHLMYRFWKEDLPAFHAETRAVAAADVQPKVVLATVPSWPEKSRWFAQVNDPQFASDEAIRAKVAELTRGVERDEDKIAAIVHWSADNIRYSGITMGKGEGYTLHSGTMIFGDRSGVCKDKAGMAITMLRAAGYEAYPAMTMAGARVERIPADQFNHCVVARKKADGGFEMLDPTWVVFSPEVWSSAEGEQHYVIGTPRGEELQKTPAFDPEGNKVRIDSVASLDEKGNLSGTLTISGRGVADQRLRREMVHAFAARDRQAWFEEVVSHLGAGATVEKVRVDYAKLQEVGMPVRFEVRYRVPGYALAEGSRLIFAPPASRHPVAQPSLAPYLPAADDDTRTQAVQLGAPRMMDVSETLTLPAGFRVVALPKDRALDGKAASLSTSSKVKDGKLAYTYRLTVKRREVAVADYGNFRDVVRESKTLPDDPVVIERGR
jgi:transglutaminase-like putative cysteine protease